MSTQQPTEAARPPFFSMSATKCCVEPGATPRGLVADAALLLGSGRAVLLENMESLTEAQWAGLYLVQQAHALVLHASSLLNLTSDGGTA